MNRELKVDVQTGGGGDRRGNQNRHGSDGRYQQNQSGSYQPARTQQSYGASQHDHHDGGQGGGILECISLNYRNFAELEHCGTASVAMSHFLVNVGSLRCSRLQIRSAEKVQLLQFFCEIKAEV